MARRYKSNKKMRSSKKYKWNKRGFNRKRRATTKVRSVVPIGLGFPKKILITHKYCETGIITNMTGVMNKYLFKCNGMYDPNQTGGGHQPIYFDQMSALYNHYCVIGSRIRVTFGMYPGQSGFGNYRCGLFISDTANPAGITNFNDIAEQGSARWKFLSGDVTTGQMDQRSLTDKWSAKKYFGKGVLANDELQGTGSTDPTELSYYYLAVEPISDTVTESLQFAVEIDYIAVWKELKPIGAS